MQSARPPTRLLKTSQHLPSDNVRPVCASLDAPSNCVVRPHLFLRVGHTARRRIRRAVPSIIARSVPFSPLQALVISVAHESLGPHLSRSISNSGAPCACTCAPSSRSCTDHNSSNTSVRVCSSNLTGAAHAGLTAPQAAASSSAPPALCAAEATTINAE